MAVYKLKAERYNTEDVMNIQNVFAMANEPLANMNVDDIREWLSEHNDKQNIIDAYASVHNQAWWIEDNEYDYEEGTTAYAYACEQTDAWFALTDELQEIIFGYLREEGIAIPKKGYISVLAPFMERHGYYYGNGWWITKE